MRHARRAAGRSGAEPDAFPLHRGGAHDRCTHDCPLRPTVDGRPECPPAGPDPSADGIAHADPEDIAECGTPYDGPQADAP